VFASPVAGYLLGYGSDVGYRPVLLEPDADRAAAGSPAGVKVAASFAELSDPAADVVVTDHHRPELGPVLRDVLAGQAHWIGVMGSPRHPAPHIPALTALGVSEAGIARVHRPIGLNIGSKTPAEIAIATIAGLIAERNGCPGGFDFSS
jgi:xanthine/CO dehydrogenase XdhC/CoxF family maturation factor